MSDAVPVLKKKFSEACTVNLSLLKTKKRVIHMAGHTERQWQGKFFRCGMRCFYCLKPLTLQEATKEHLTPQARGGADTIDNIVPACKACNEKKGDMTEPEFRTTFSKAFEILTRVGAAEREMSLSMRDEPSLDHLRSEAESISWAWRNPA
jgi:hypothetical protein